MTRSINDQCMNGLRPTTKKSSAVVARSAAAGAPAWSSRIDATRRPEPPRTAGARADGRVPRPRQAEARKRAVAAEDLAARAAVVAAAEDGEAELALHARAPLLVGDPARRRLVRRRELAAAADAATAAAVRDPRRAQLLLDLGAHLLAPRRAHERRRVVAAERAALERTEAQPDAVVRVLCHLAEQPAPAAAQQREAEAQRRRRAERVAGVARAVGARGEEQLVPNAQQRRERDAADKRRAEPRVRHDLRDVGDFGDVDRRGHRQPLRRERRHLAGEPLQSRKRRAVEVGRVEHAERRAKGPERALLGERRWQAARLQHHGEQHRREEVEALRVAARRQRAPRVQHASQRALVEVVDAVDARPIDVDGDHVGVRLRDDCVHEVVVRPRRAAAHGVGAEAQRPAQRAVLEERRPAVELGARARAPQFFARRRDASSRRTGGAAAAVQREVTRTGACSTPARGVSRRSAAAQCERTGCADLRASCTARAELL